jgi:2,4-dienoyl-CoA reductase-like NADH-dependent reductase (Old Yellow Enzyme family)
MPKLSDPITIRNMEVKNRVGFPPMMSSSSDGQGRPTEGNILVYEQKAKGGTGILTYEASTIDPNVPVGGTQPNIGRKENIPAFQKLTNRVHKQGAKFGIQIVHGGILGFMGVPWGLKRIFAPSKVDEATAASAYHALYSDWPQYIKDNDIQIVPLSIEMIIGIEDLMAQAAANGIQAGFDYIEVHSTHGTLYHDFISPYYNQRTDEYGGSLENKFRFAKETISKMRKAIGEEPPIFFRIAGDSLTQEGIKLEDAIKNAQMYEKLGVDCLDVSMGINVRTPQGITPPSYIPQGGFIHLAASIKNVVDIPVMGVGRITNLKMADDFIQQGKADIINLGRQLICDPESANKYFSGHIEDIKTCFGCIAACGVGVCVYDPYTGPFQKDIIPTTNPRKILILGGGIAGMEAARVCAIRGHQVHLYEKSDKLGGLMHLVAAEYKKEEYINLPNWLQHQLNILETPIHLNSELSIDDIISINPDVLVFAIGTKAALPIKYKDRANVVTQDEAILKSKSLGKDIVIWGLDTYWRGGVETAITLMEQGYNVKAIIGQEDIMGRSIRGLSGRYLWIYEYFKEKKLPLIYNSKLEDVTDTGVKYIDSKGEEQFIEADTLVFCGSRITEKKKLEKEFEGKISKVVFIGDCNQPRDIREAIKDAHDFAREI